MKRILTSRGGTTIGVADGSEAAAPAPSKKKIILLCVLLVMAMGLLCIAVGVLFVVAKEELPVTQEDRGVLLSVAAVAPYLDQFEPQLQLEMTAKTRSYLDGELYLTQEYHHPSDPDSPYCFSSVTVSRTSSDALIAFGTEWSATSFGMKVSDRKFSVQRRDDLFRYGASSRFAMILHDGDPVGNLFVCRHKRNVFTWTLSGAYFDDAELLAQILEPVLKRWSDYKP